MKKIYVCTLLLLTTLVIPNKAMEEPLPKKRRLGKEPEQPTNTSLVRLSFEDDASTEILRSLACLSPYLAGYIDAQEGNAVQDDEAIPIPPHIQKSTIEDIANAILFIDHQMVYESENMITESILRNDGSISYRNLQPLINASLHDKTADEIKAFINACHFLDFDPLLLYGLINSATKVYVDKAINKEIPLQREQFEKYLDNTFANDIHPFIKKHRLLKYAYAYLHDVPVEQVRYEELSIGDYVMLCGQPELTKDYEINLSNSGITSLQGIHEIEDTDEATLLDLSNNFILDFTLDTEFPEKPFNKFENITELSLHTNQLLYLCSQMFEGLKNIQIIKLYNNPLQNTDDKTLFAKLPILEKVYFNEEDAPEETNGLGKEEEEGEIAERSGVEHE